MLSESQRGQGRGSDWGGGGKGMVCWGRLVLLGLADSDGIEEDRGEMGVGMS